MTAFREGMSGMLTHSAKGRFVAAEQEPPTPSHAVIRCEHEAGLTDPGHLRAELVLEVLDGHLGVLDGVVQDGGLEDLDGRVRVQARLGRREEECDVERVLDVGRLRCRFPALLVVRDGGKVSRLEELRHG